MKTNFRLFSRRVVVNKQDTENCERIRSVGYHARGYNTSEANVIEWGGGHFAHFYRLIFHRYTIDVNDCFVFTRCCMDCRCVSPSGASVEASYNS